MKTVFDISGNVNYWSSYPHQNFEITTPHRNHHLQWILTVQNISPKCRSQTIYDLPVNKFDIPVNSLPVTREQKSQNLNTSGWVPKVDLEFSLLLTEKNQLGIRVACVTFCVEGMVNDTDVKTSSHGFSLISNVYNVETPFRKRCRKTNVKINDELKCQINFDITIVKIRCAIKLVESTVVEAKQSSSPSIADSLLNDAITSTEPADQFADVTLITADDRKFYVHGCFLAKQSSVFNAMLKEEKFKEGKERQIETPDINSATMKEILRYIYTEYVNNDALKSLAPEILYVTEKYHLPEPLKLQCCQVMIDSLNVTNALTFLLTADMYSLVELKRSAIKVVVGNLNKVRQQDEWKEILKKHPNLVDEIFAFAASHINLN